MTAEQFPKTPVDPIPERATILSEWVRCGKSNCSKCPHGPFYFAYWKEGGKRRKRYIGKSWDEYDARRIFGRPRMNGRRAAKLLDDMWDNAKKNHEAQKKKHSGFMIPFEHPVQWVTREALAADNE